MSLLSESVATLYVVRNPEKGTFGTVTVQFTIKDANGSLAEDDLMPAQGFVVLEDGVRFKVRECRFKACTFCNVVVKWICFEASFFSAYTHTEKHFTN